MTIDPAAVLAIMSDLAQKLAALEAENAELRAQVQGPEHA